MRSLSISLILLCLATASVADDSMGNGQQRLLGIKFAEAGRWERPTVVPFYQDVHYGELPPHCPQQREDRVIGIEDCLYLNVIAPESPIDAPVVVWFHGGGFVAGYSGDWVERAHRFTDAGVIFVAPNYRLGRFGNVATEGAQGNFALSDMQAALKWVQNNIESLGGDPGNVTIMGESAGGMAVQMLMSSPKSEGLFAKAVSMSGYGTWPMPTAEVLEPSTSVTFDDDVYTVVTSVDGFLIPYIDPEVLPLSPYETFMSGTQMRVPLIIGSNSFDGSVMPASGVDVPELFSLLGDQAESIYSVYQQQFVSGELSVASLFGDLRYGLPTTTMGEAHGAAGNTAYLYYLDYVPESLVQVLPGAPHGIELPLMMGYQPAGVPPEIDLTNDTFGSQLFSTWLGFIKDGSMAGPLEFSPTQESVVVNALGRQDRVTDFTSRLELIESAMLK